MFDTNILNVLNSIQNQVDCMRKEIQSVQKSVQEKHNIPRDRYTIREVAEIAGCSTETIKNHVRDGYLKVRYPRAKKRFHADDVDKYLRGRL